jgi:hypothetical protein
MSPVVQAVVRALIAALAVGGLITATIAVTDRPETAIVPVVDPCAVDDRAEGHESCR